MILACKLCGKPVSIDARRVAQSKSGSFFCSHQHYVAAGRQGICKVGRPRTSKSKDAGHQICRRLFRHLMHGPCEACGKSPAELHHKDGNPLNNSRSNIVLLCKRHHMEQDGRLEALRQLGLSRRGKAGPTSRRDSAGRYTQ